jgi:hypothetical protein
VPTPERRARARVEFDDLAWDEDLAGASDTARELAARTRARLEREGQPINELRPCETEGPQGTSLPGCVKAYLPPPDGRWGIVYRIARRRDEPTFLAAVAFGPRHPPSSTRQPSVYARAHRRLRSQRGGGRDS